MSQVRSATGTLKTKQSRGAGVAQGRERVRWVEVKEGLWPLLKCYEVT